MCALQRAASDLHGVGRVLGCCLCALFLMSLDHGPPPVLCALASLLE